MTPDWLRRVLAAVRPLLPKEFVGQIEINVFRGGISNINVRQSYKEDKVEPTPPRNT